MYVERISRCALNGSVCFLLTVLVVLISRTSRKHQLPWTATNGQGIPPGGRRRLKKLVQTRKIKVATLNVESMTGRNGEVVHIMARKHLQVLCVQETKWRGSKAREMCAGYKLYYHGEDGTTIWVGIVLCDELKYGVLAVERPSNRVRRMKLEIEGEVWNIICYAPQTGCTKYEKDQFWETIDSEMQAVKRSERLVVAGDLNGHVGSAIIGYEEVHGRHGVGSPNEDGMKLLDFATAYHLRILNTSYQKEKEPPGITYQWWA